MGDGRGDAGVAGCRSPAFIRFRFSLGYTDCGESTASESDLAGAYPRLLDTFGLPSDLRYLLAAHSDHSPMQARYVSHSAISTGKAVGNPVDGCRGFLAIEALAG